jgi:hypothetical protein
MSCTQPFDNPARVCCIRSFVIAEGQLPPFAMGRSSIPQLKAVRETMDRHIPGYRQEHQGGAEYRVI